MIDVCEFLDKVYEIFPVPSDFIGVVYSKNTREILAIVNPAYDWQLADHRTDENGLLLMRRGKFPMSGTPYWTYEIIKRAKRVLQ